MVACNFGRADTAAGVSVPIRENLVSIPPRFQLSSSHCTTIRTQRLFVLFRMFIEATGGLLVHNVKKINRNYISRHEHPKNVVRLIQAINYYALWRVLSKCFTRPVIFALAVSLSMFLTHTADASSLCGNNIIEHPEKCDDGNQISGDACSATCEIEVGHLSCGLGAPLDCGQVCGDGILAGTESCDDGNAANGDGCSSTCTIETPATFDCPLAFDQRQKNLFPNYTSPRANGERAQDNDLQPLKNNFEPILDAIPYCNGLPAETPSRKFLLEYKLLVVIDQSWIDFYTAHQSLFSIQGYQTLLESPQILFDRVNYLYERQFGVRFSTRTVIANGLLEDCRADSVNVENQSIPATLTAQALQALGVEKYPDEAMIYRIGVGGKTAYCGSYAGFYPFGTNWVATNQQAPFVGGFLNHRAAITLAHELGHSFGMLSNSGHPHFDTAHLIAQVPDIMVYNGLPIEGVRTEGMFFNFLTSCTPTYTQNVCAAVKATSRALTTRMVCNGEFGNCSVDTDADGEPDALDTDDDGDGVADEDDDFPLDPAASADTDRDGAPDQWNDGLNENSSTSRPRLALDPDTDGDGVDNSEDAFPTDPMEDTDTDGDGIGDNGDAFPTDPTEDTDTDSDGIGDNGDAFPTDPTEDTDTDGDGVGDKGDAFPTDPIEDTDSDDDGVGDNGDAGGTGIGIRVIGASAGCVFSEPVSTSAINESGAPGTGIGLQLSYVLTGCGSSVTVEAVFGSNLPKDARAYKVTETGQWREIGTVQSIIGNTIRYVVTDGGDLDQDSVAGQITDPVSAAVPPSTPATPVPTFPLWVLWLLAGGAGIVGTRSLRKAGEFTMQNNIQR